MQQSLTSTLVCKIMLQRFCLSFSFQKYAAKFKPSPLVCKNMLQRFFASHLILKKFSKVFLTFSLQKYAIVVLPLV